MRLHATLLLISMASIAGCLSRVVSPADASTDSTAQPDVLPGDTRTPPSDVTSNCTLTLDQPLQIAPPGAARTLGQTIAVRDHVMVTWVDFRSSTTSVASVYALGVDSFGVALGLPQLLQQVANPTAVMTPPMLTLDSGFVRAFWNAESNCMTALLNRDGSPATPARSIGSFHCFDLQSSAGVMTLLTHAAPFSGANRGSPFGPLRQIIVNPNGTEHYTSSPLFAPGSSVYRIRRIPLADGRFLTLFATETAPLESTLDAMYLTPSGDIVDNRYRVAEGLIDVGEITGTATPTNTVVFWLGLNTGERDSALNVSVFGRDGTMLQPRLQMNNSLPYVTPESWQVFPYDGRVITLWPDATRERQSHTIAQIFGADGFPQGDYLQVTRGGGPPALAVTPNGALAIYQEPQLYAVRILCR